MHSCITCGDEFEREFSRSKRRRCYRCIGIYKLAANAAHMAKKTRKGRFNRVPSVREIKCVKCGKEEIRRFNGRKPINCLECVGREFTRCRWKK